MSYPIPDEIRHLAVTPTTFFTKCFSWITFLEIDHFLSYPVWRPYGRCIACGNLGREANEEYTKLLNKSVKWFYCNDICNKCGTSSWVLWICKSKWFTQYLDWDKLPEVFQRNALIQFGYDVNKHDADIRRIEKEVNSITRTVSDTEDTKKNKIKKPNDKLVSVETFAKELEKQGKDVDGFLKIIDQIKGHL